MSPDKEALLRRDFPQLYMHLRYGFECGDGWFGLLQLLSEDLEALQLRWPPEWHVCAAQVKEKFGGLRFYLRYPRQERTRWMRLKEWLYHKGQRLPLIGGWIARLGRYAPVHALIRAAEELAIETCDVCGEPGCLREGSWLRTRCDPHAEGAPPRAQQ